MNHRVNLLITGRVQGVFFRASTQKQAEKLGVNGFVRNLPDGRVEVVAEGEPTAVEKLVAWCHQGPRGARIDKVDVSKITGDHIYREFQIRSGIKQ